MPRSSRNQNSNGGRPIMAHEQADRLERVAVPIGDGRTLAFIRRTVVQVDGSMVVLEGADGQRYILHLDDATAYGTPRLPTARADVIPGAVVAAMVEQIDDVEDLALRIVVIPPAPAWSRPPRSSA
jgi:hypothetical protein